MTNVHYLDPSGMSQVAQGKVVVVACSAIESVRLLKLSAALDHGFDQHINQNDLLGKYFLTHCFGEAEANVPGRFDKSVTLDARSNELARTLQLWNFDASGSKNHAHMTENFFAVDYMDLHLLKGHCGIGLHRHRDNQEVFLMMQGRGFMVVGDWCKMPQRERCFEIRTLRAGHFAMLKGGNLHALINPGDQDLSLFMFGGYD